MSKTGSASGFRVAVWAAILGIAGLVWLAEAPLRIWHVTGPDGKPHPDGATWAAYGTGGAVIMAVLMAASITAARRQALSRPRMVMPAVTEALEIAGEVGPGPAPANWPPRACAHPCAVKVGSSPDPDETVAWLCPDCDLQMDPGFGLHMRRCCPSEPGDPHWGTCGHRARWNELNDPKGS